MKRIACFIVLLALLVVHQAPDARGARATAADFNQTGNLTATSAASFAGTPLAAESIAALFGSGLATTTQMSASLPLPTALAGTAVKVRDSVGGERLAPLFFVSPTQINCQIPAGTSDGLATITVTSGNGFVSVGTVQIARVAPGLFAANANGQGVAAGLALRVKGDNSQSYEPIANFDLVPNKFIPRPISLGSASDQVFLVLYGTGWRSRTSLSSVNVKVGGEDAQVVYAGPQPNFVGLDQLNVRLARSLAGKGEVDVVVTVDGRAANTVRVSVEPPVRPLAVATVREIGALSQPASLFGRDGGPSALIGGKILWTFGDTFIRTRAEDNANYRSNTAALADPNTPLVLTEPLDAKGVPYPIVPFTPEEQAYNDSTGRPDDRIALWPGTLMPDGQGGGLIYYAKLYIKPGGLNYQAIGTGLAHVAAGQTRAVREPGLLFTAPEPGFSEAFLLGETVYVYANLPQFGNDLPYGVARAPLNQATQRAAYRYWNGSDWVADINQARPVMTLIPGGLSVSFNAYLNQYLAVHGGIFSNKIYARTAPRPEGPWSQPVEIMTGLPPFQGTVDYLGLEHPEMVKDSGRTIVVSYARPTGNFLGEVRLAEVTFK